MGTIPTSSNADAGRKEASGDAGRGIRSSLREATYGVLAVAFAAGTLSFFGVLFVVYIWPRPVDAMLTRLVTEHFAALVGVPMIALASFIVVFVFSITQGEIEMEGWGIKFKGASGPIVFWLFVFSAIVGATKLLW